MTHIYVNLRLHQKFEALIPKITDGYKYCQGPLEYGNETRIPHFHLVIFGNIKTIQTRIFNLGIKGNEHYSTSKTDNLITSISYSCKMGVPLSYSLDVPIETIPKWIFKTVTEKKRELHKKFGVCQTIIMNCPTTISDTDVFEYIWESYGHTNSPFDETHIYRIYNSIMCRRNNQKHKEEMKLKLKNLLMKNKYLSI